MRLVTDTTGGQKVNSFKYDYSLKDHLGNTRMVLTDKQETDQYPMASMEVGDSATENLYYTMLDNTRAALPAGYPTDTTTKPNQYVAELYSNGNNTVIGPGVVLKVMAGDQFSVRATSWYQLNGTTPGIPLNPLTDVVTALIAGVAASPGEGATAAALQANPAPLSPNVMQFLADTGANIINTRPHAFLNWVLFDNQFNFVSASSGFQQVGANGVLTPMTLMNLPITSSGYLYIYTSNATANVPVFFDNLQVTHTRGPLLEEDHYYPFGLTMAGISDKALKSNYAENKYRFQKQELENHEFSDGSGLEMYEFKYRFEDDQTGRFWSIDPLANDYVYNSPYAFSENKVTGHVELEGLEARSIISGEATTGGISGWVATAMSGDAPATEGAGEAMVAFTGVVIHNYVRAVEKVQAMVSSSSNTTSQDATGPTAAPSDPAAVQFMNTLNNGVLPAISPAPQAPLATPTANTGTIYKVPGTATKSGKPYIGRHNQSDRAKTRKSNDGRDRTAAKVIDTYDPTNVKEGRQKEQQAIDDHGGVDNLDNKRNEKKRS